MHSALIWGEVAGNNLVIPSEAIHEWRKNRGLEGAHTTGQLTPELTSLAWEGFISYPGPTIEMFFIEMQMLVLTSNLPVAQVGHLPLQVGQPNTPRGQTVSQVLRGSPVRQGLPRQIIRGGGVQ